MNQYVRGVFVEECKNRFLCIVKIRKEQHLCYVASSARLSNFIELSNKKVLLVENKGSNTRTRFTLYAVKSEFGYIILNLSVANTLLGDNLRKDYPKNISVLKEKVTHEGYKTDFLVSTSLPTIVEAKSIITDKTSVIFPTVFGERAVYQLTALQRALQMGYKVRYCLVLLSPTVSELLIDVRASEFYVNLKKCIELGMEIEVYRLKNTRKLRFYLNRDIQIEMSILRNEVLCDA
ncbi:hypothetical protein AMQ83_32640 [Paenibacillus riograndensis]|nr:hypothetical protein AMQ83_32640 [Paenibacillus riograndensis]